MLVTKSVLLVAGNKIFNYAIVCNISKKMSVTNENCSWRGVPLSEMYGSQSPWGAPEFPLISPAYNHTVLYHISGENQDIPPKPQPGHDKWDKDYVRMPCSSQSLYPVVREDGKSTLKRRWNIIEQALQKPIRNSEDLAKAILSYNTNFITVWKFSALHKLFNEYLEEEESEYFFNVTIVEIVKLALALPKLIQGPIPLLKQHKNRAVSLSQQQISCLLANAFFCTFPRRNTTKRDSEYASYPRINFNMLYESSGSIAVLEKLKCICHYFRRVCTKVPVGVMTFIRHTVPPEKCPQWSDSTKFVGGTPLHVDAEGTIEDALGLVQVDFANKFLGGGVLRRGCVQEEIRFVICPELLVSMLFTEVLDPTEALLMIGCERFSKYTGYGSTFQWAGDYQDTTPYDSSRRKRCVVLAIDALPFRRKLAQYEPESIVRELNKAWVGVSSCVWSQEQSVLVYPGVATGNWGCGAFGGSARVKSLLQLMACTEAGRPMAYYTFADADLRNDLINMYNVLSKHNVTVGQLFNYIIKYTPVKAKSKKTQRSETITLHDFLYQLIMDSDDGTLMETSQENFESPWTSTDFSKDIFEEEDMLIDATVLFESSTLKLHDAKYEHSQPETSLHETKSNRRNSKSSTLFDEMTTFDVENGKLNLNNETKSVLDALNVDNKVSSDRTSKEITGNVETSEKNQSGNKKKIGKKITDYFNKRAS